MRNRFFIFLVIYSLLASCKLKKHYKGEKIAFLKSESIDERQNEEDSVYGKILSKQKDIIIKKPERIDIDSLDILPVYKVSKNSYGIIRTIDDAKYGELISGVLDSTLNLYYSKNFSTSYLKVVDTTGNLGLFENKIINTALSSEIDKEYIVYTSEGNFKSKIKDVLLYPNECRTSFILLRFNKKLDKNKLPLFASKNSKNMIFDNFSKQESVYNLTVDSIGKDYPDDEHISIYAMFNEIYLGYRDDIEFNNEKHENYYKNLNIYFPNRVYLKFKNSKIQKLEKIELDLFGVPCD